MRRELRWSVAVLGMVWACAVMAQKQAVIPPEHERSGGPYVPTPNLVVDRMLGFANVGAQDHVIDLGSGDGIIVITAAQRHKASGYGVDIDEELIRLSNQRAKSLGIDGRVRFEARDIFQADVSKATVVTLYLLPEMMRRLRGKLYAELQPGARVVSHDYHFEEWQHDAEIAFDVPEKELITGVPSATLYLWTVPARIDGAWRMHIDGNGEYELTLNQRYQKFDGAAVHRSHKATLQETRLQGTEISFVLPLGSGHGHFSGRINGDQIEGTANLGGGKVARWRAVRNRTS